MVIQNKRLIAILAAVFALLLVPFIAMQFTDDVQWGAIDFIVAGSLLLGTGLACDYVLRKVTSRRYRLIACGVILLVLLIIWAELAVGIFGTPFAGS